MYGSNPLTAKQAILHEKKRAHARTRRRLFLVLFLVLVGGFFYGIRQPNFRVKNIEVVGNGLVDNTEVKDFISKEISGYRYFLIPRDSLFFLEKDLLIQDVMKEFPRLSTVTIHTGSILNVKITESVFDTMFCTLDKDMNNPSGCVLLHPNGKSGSIAPEYSYSPLFSFYSSKTDLVLGSVIINPDEMKRIALLRVEFQTYNIPTYGYIYGKEYDEMLIDTGDNFASLPRVRLLSGATSDEVSKTLGIAAGDPTVKKLLLEKLNEIQYVDLRFDGQVVYKKKGEL